MNLRTVLESDDAQIFEVRTHASGPQGSLPITPEMLLQRPSGDLFGLTQNAGMGWEPAALGGNRVPDPQHARRDPRGGWHARSRWGITRGTGKSGCWWRRRRAELNGAAVRCRSPAPAPIPAMAARRAPRACSIRLPYRNDAAMVLRRLIRSLPTRSGVLGVATCDKGLPAMMMALAAMRDLPCVLVPAA